jgi:hypothetical protein
MFFPQPCYALRLVEEHRRELLRSARKPQQDHAFDKPVQAPHMSMRSRVRTLSSRGTGLLPAALASDRATARRFWQKMIVLSRR